VRQQREMHVCFSWQKRPAAFARPDEFPPNSEGEPSHPPTCSTAKLSKELDSPLKVGVPVIVIDPVSAGGLDRRPVIEFERGDFQAASIIHDPVMIELVHFCSHSPLAEACRPLPGFLAAIIRNPAFLTAPAWALWARDFSALSHLQCR
jgi:hypothetical protein